MAFSYPVYRAPDFSEPRLQNAPDAAWAVAERDGVAHDLLLLGVEDAPRGCGELHHRA